MLPLFRHLFLAEAFVLIFLILCTDAKTELQLVQGKRRVRFFLNGLLLNNWNNDSNPVTQIIF